MGDKTLTVRRANQGTMQPKPEQESILLYAQQQIAFQVKLVIVMLVMSLLRLNQLRNCCLFQVNMLQPGPVATTVVCLTQVVNEDELRDDEEFEDIMDDMRQEGGKFGAFTNVLIPRPSPSGEPVAGLGKVFLKYGDTDGSSRARSGMNGRKFGGNEVIAVFYPEDKFDLGDYGA
ncbi:splicing factor U2af large subunit A [Brassica napus]|nr:splicing factor U2af large subunit A [Brassica napus]